MNNNGYIFNSNLSNFLMYSYFGITEEEIKNSKDKKYQKIIAKKCADRAYLDLNRTLCFNDKLNEANTSSNEKSDIEKQRRKFRDEFSEIIVDSIIDELLEMAKDNVSLSEEVFDKWHENVCVKKVRDKAQKTQKEDGTELILAVIPRKKNEQRSKEENLNFYDGQAQKWVNMTMKYMWLIGFWTKEFEKFEAVMHVPVDSFIIEAVWHEGLDETKKKRLANKDDIKKLKVKLPCVKEKRMYKYSEDKVVPWSKWAYEEYLSFQKSLRRDEEQEGVFKDKKPLEWECENWIKVAENRKQSKENYKSGE